MCLILFAWRTHPEHSLVLAANRDEVRNRPSRPAAFWPDAPDVLAGRDLFAGGSWLGLNRNGRIAALTNYRDPALTLENKVSRGRLVADFLTTTTPPEAYLETLQKTADDYNGYNLIFGDGESLWVYSNVSRAGQSLAPGVYGMSNHLLDTPWPKVARAKSALNDALASLPNRAPLFELLSDDAIAPDHLLPRTGVSVEWERLLSAALIRGEAYGTCSSTVVLRSGAYTTFEEISWSATGAVSSHVKASIAYPGG